MVVKDELFTLYFGSKTREPVEKDDDLEDGTFSDEEDLLRVQATEVPGRLTVQSSQASETSLRLFLLPGTAIKSGWRVKRDKTGTIYVVSNVIQSKLAGSDLIVELRE